MTDERGDQTDRRVSLLCERCDHPRHAEGEQLGDWCAACAECEVRRRDGAAHDDPHRYSEAHPTHPHSEFCIDPVHDPEYARADGAHRLTGEAPMTDERGDQADRRPRTAAGRALAAILDVSAWFYDDDPPLREWVCRVEDEAAAEADAAGNHTHYDTGETHAGTLRACYREENRWLRVALAAAQDGDR